MLPGEDGVTVSYTRDGVADQVTARHAVVATKAFEAAAIVRGLPDDTRSALEAIPYGPTVVMAVLDRRAGADAVGRHLRAGDAQARLQHAVQHRQRGARAARPPAHRRQPDDVPLRRTARCRCWSSPTATWSRRSWTTCSTFPQARGHVRETQLLKLPRMLPYPAPGRAALQPALDRPLGRVHLAGDYLGGVYSDTAIASGQEAALPIRRSLA